MSKKGLKLALAVFLALVGIITPLALKNNVRAANYQFNMRYVVAPITTVNSLNLSTGSNLMVDYSNRPLVWRCDELQSVVGFSYYVVRYGYSSSTVSYLFYRPNTDYYTTPIFSASFNYIGSASGNNYIRFNSVSNPGNYNNNDILNILVNYGFILVNGYAIGGATSSIIVSDTSTTYEALKCLKAVDTSDFTYMEGLQAGINRVIENPNNYGLHTQEEIENSYNSGVSSGYENGYNSGYTDGLADADHEAFTFNAIVRNVFSSAGEFLNTQIVGRLKLVHFLAIPLLLGLFVIVLKVFRG